MTTTITTRTALVIDDFRFNRALLRNTLTRLGYAVVEAVGAKEAFASLEQQPFDVIFLDWFLPGDMQGDAIARVIREKHPTAPIIAITADTSEEMRAACFAAGVDGFLSKAFDQASVQAMLDTTRSRHNAPATPASSTDLGIRTLLTNLSNDFPGGGSAMLKYCRAQFDNEWQQLIHATENNLLSQAILAAHNLGSLAGIIGASALHDAAHSCENALHCAETITDIPVKKSMERLSALLSTLHADLSIEEEIEKQKS